MLFATPRTACLSLGLAALLVGLGIALTGAAERYVDVPEPEVHFDPATRAIGTETVCFTTARETSLLAGVPLLVGAGLLATAALLPRRRPAPGRARSL